MKRYWVTLPIVGTASISVEAEDEKSAIEAAFENLSNEHINEWEALPNGCPGNVCYLPVHGADVIEDKDA